MKRGAKRNGGPDYVGAFCFESSLPFDPFDFAQAGSFARNDRERNAMAQKCYVLPEKLATPF